MTAPEYRELILQKTGLKLVTMFDVDQNLEIYINDDILASLQFEVGKSKSVIIVYKETIELLHDKLGKRDFLKSDIPDEFAWAEFSYKATHIDLWHCVLTLCTDIEKKGANNG